MHGQYNHEPSSTALRKSGFEWAGNDTNPHGEVNEFNNIVRITGCCLIIAVRVPLFLSFHFFFHIIITTTRA